jgi:Clp amino terminal domain, pathogenicity island component
MFNRLNPEARIAVMQAIDEARELGHAEVGADHVLLGLLANVRGETYALLTSHGLDFTKARSIVVDQHIEPTRDELSQTEPTELDEDREALRAIGIDLDKVREAVKSTFGDDITEGWGERGPQVRGRGPRRGPRGRHHHHHHGEGGPDAGEQGEERRGGRGRRGPRSERFGDRPMFSAELRDALRATVRGARRGAPDGERRGPGGPKMTATMLLTAIAQSQNPAVETILDSAKDQSALREAITAYAGQPTA